MNTMQSHGTGVPNMIGSLSEPDILASQQYYDQETSGRQPERSLMFDPQYLRKGLLRWKRNVLQLSAKKDRNKRSA